MKIRHVRVIGFWEGTSYLVLLGIAMPMKYLFDEPLAVRIVGFLHGLLFMVYVLVGVQVGRQHGWPFSRLFKLGLAAVLPGGPFVFDRWLVEQESLFQQPVNTVPRLRD